MTSGVSDRMLQPAPPSSIVTVAQASLSPRAVLTARWREQLDRLTELSIQRHDTPRRDGLDDGRLDVQTAIDAVRRELRDTEDALNRVSQRTYGRCESCDQPIDRLRLIGFPATRICRRCQSATLTSSRR